MMPVNTTLLTTLLALPLLADARAVVDVTVIDVVRGEALPHRTVLVDGEAIVAVGAVDDVEVPDGVEVIAGAGRFLMPGLSDMHVHYSHAPTFGPLLVANGVTLVRDTGGYTDQMIALRRSLETWETFGPELICTGAIVDGPNPIWPFSEACATPKDGLGAVKRLAEAGVDQIKVYSGLRPDVFRVIVEEAHRRGLAVTGHIPVDVPLGLALQVGMDCNEHLMGFGLALHELLHGEPVVGEDRFSIDSGRGWLAYDELDEDLIDMLAARVASAGMVQSPTLVVGERISRLKDPALREDPLLEYVPDFFLEWWAPENDFRFQSWTDETYALEREAHLRARKLVHRLWKAGVRIVSGTDLSNPYLVPGFSLLDELELYAEAGLPPAAVLRTTTIEAAKLAGLADRLGTVEAGKTASLVLLRANPLEDVSNVRELDGVFLRGRWFDRSALDGLLEEARTSAAEPTGVGSAR